MASAALAAAAPRRRVTPLLRRVRRSPPLVVGLVLFGALLLMAAFAPLCQPAGRMCVSIRQLR